MQIWKFGIISVRKEERQGSLQRRGRAQDQMKTSLYNTTQTQVIVIILVI